MNKYLALAFDKLYLKLANDKKCNLILEEDEFDGKIYDIDNFHNYIARYYSNPSEFYKKTAGFTIQLENLRQNKNENFFSGFFNSPHNSKWANNNKVPIRWYKKDSLSKVLLIFAHGWARPNLFAEDIICKKLLKKGIDTIVPTAPFHMERAPTNSMSGEYFISGNIYWTIANFRQFADELIELVSYYKEKYKYIGIIGMSSGGFQAGLALTSIPVDFYFPFITGAKLGSITWEGQLTKFVKQDIIKKGISESELNKVWGIADQANLGKYCKATYIKQFISLYDIIVPTKFQYKLWEIYNRPEKIELKCGHNSSIFCFNTVVEEIHKSVKNYLK
jgi:hypothetical protein